MYETYERLHNEVLSITKKVEGSYADEQEMFNLIQSLDCEFELAVKTIHRLEKLIITKEMENYNIK